MDACPTHNAAAHIHHPLVAVEARYLLCLHFSHDTIWLAHHRRNFLGREFHCCYALPRDGVECRGREVGQEFGCLYDFASECPGSCDALVIVAAFPCLPSVVGCDKCLPFAFLLQLVYLCQDVRPTFGNTYNFRIVVETAAKPDDEVVATFA